MNNRNGNKPGYGDHNNGFGLMQVNNFFSEKLRLKIDCPKIKYRTTKFIAKILVISLGKPLIENIARTANAVQVTLLSLSLGLSLKNLSKISQKSLKSLSKVSQKSLKSPSKVSQKSLKSVY